jgi:hypothetical protein
LSTEVIGRMDLLPTTIEEGMSGLGGRKREMLPGSGVEWFDAHAPESATHSVSEGGHSERHHAEGFGQ